jgi:hypothetical protein
MSINNNTHAFRNTTDEIKTTGGAQSQTEISKIKNSLNEK